MDWQITGANRQTGEDVVFTVQALSEDAAREQAQRMGCVVSSVSAMPYAPQPQTAQYRPSRALAGVLSLLIPGAGQMYLGQATAGVLILLACILLYAMAPCTLGITLVFAIILHLISVLVALLS